MEEEVSQEVSAIIRNQEILSKRAQFVKVVRPKIGEMVGYQDAEDLNQKQKSVVFDIAANFASVVEYGRITTEYSREQKDPEDNKKRRAVDPLIDGYKDQLQKANISNVELWMAVVKSSLSDIRSAYHSYVAKKSSR